MTAKLKAYKILCGTGCTCCNYEDHIRGPYRTEEDAKRRVTYYYAPESSFYPLASQFARRGVYRIRETILEPISDGRWIVDEVHVVPKLDYIDVNPDGTINVPNASEVWDI